MGVIVDSIIKASMKLLSSDNLTMIFVAFNNFKQIFNSNNTEKIALSVSQIKEKNIVLYSFKDNVKQSPVKNKNSSNCLSVNKQNTNNTNINTQENLTSPEKDRNRNSKNNDDKGNLEDNFSIEKLLNKIESNNSSILKIKEEKSSSIAQTEEINLNNQVKNDKIVNKTNKQTESNAIISLNNKSGNVTPKIKNKSNLNSKNDVFSSGNSKTKVNPQNSVSSNILTKSNNQTPRYDGNGNNLNVMKTQSSVKNVLKNSNSKKKIDQKSDLKSGMSSSFVQTKNTLKEKSQSFVENKLSIDSSTMKTLTNLKSPKAVNTKVINLNTNTVKSKNLQAISMQFNNIK